MMWMGQDQSICRVQTFFLSGDEWREGFSGIWT